MKAISTKYILVTKVPEEKKEGFQAVAVQDSFVNTGKVYKVPDVPVYVDSHQVKVGDTVMFAKYSPDTHEVELHNSKMKAVRVEDLLFVL